MTTFYVQHGSTGQPMHTEKVAHQITKVPLKSHPVKDKYAATEYLVRVGGVWRRVWTDLDGHLHVHWKYQNVPVIKRDAE